MRPKPPAAETAAAKGAASGLPLGLIITRPELADVFKGPHINTFGGNPLSTRAARVTLEVIEKKDLIGNAKRQGRRLLAGLSDLQKRYPKLGEVRGHGLMIGVELVKDSKTKAYATEEAARFLELMREKGILVGRGGRFGNVIRIQPALVFDANDTAEFLKTFGEVIAQL